MECKRSIKKYHLVYTTTKHIILYVIDSTSNHLPVTLDVTMYIYTKKIVVHQYIRLGQGMDFKTKYR